jgi:hypothetical protein
VFQRNVKWLEMTRGRGPVSSFGLGKKRGYRGGSLRYPVGGSPRGRLRYLKIESKKVSIAAQAMLASSS